MEQLQTVSGFQQSVKLPVNDINSLRQIIIENVLPLLFKPEIDKEYNRQACLYLADYARYADFSRLMLFTALINHCWHNGYQAVWDNLASAVQATLNNRYGHIFKLVQLSNSQCQQLLKPSDDMTFKQDWDHLQSEVADSQGYQEYCRLMLFGPARFLTAQPTPYTQKP